MPRINFLVMGWAILEDPVAFVPHSLSKGR